MHRNRRVHFEDRYTDDISSHGSSTVERLTSELRNCYDTVDKGRKLVGRLYDKLRQRDSDEELSIGRHGSIGNETLQGFQSDYQLLIEIDNLRDVLQQIAIKRGEYVKQITKAQDIMWHDQKQMEDFLQMVKTTDSRIRENVKLFSRFAQEPEHLVSELQYNSEILGDLLSDLKEQLIAEEQFIKKQAGHGVEASFTGSPRDRLSYIRGRRRGRASCRRDISPGIVEPEETSYSETRRLPEFLSGYLRQRNRSHREGDQVDSPFRDTYGNSGRAAFTRDVTDRVDIERRARFGAEEREGIGSSAQTEGDAYDTSSLSRRLKQLVRQSENVQKLIGNVSKKEGTSEPHRIKFSAVPGQTILFTAESAQRSGVGEQEREPGGRQRDESDSVKEASGYRRNYEERGQALHSTEPAVSSGVRIESADHDRPSANLDMRTVINKCDDLERNLRACSPREVRERLLYNIEQLEKADRSLDRESHEARSPTRQNSRREQLIDHGRLRNEFLLCLDKIFAMEKSYGSAEDEIRSLKKDLEIALRDRDVIEKVLQREADELNVRLQVKAKDIDSYSQRLEDARNELIELKAKYEKDLKEVAVQSELQAVPDDDVKALKEECEKLKAKVDSKSKEVDDLRKDLEDAISEIQKMKNDVPSTANIQQYKIKIVNLEEEVSRLKQSNEESIAEELVALKKVIDVLEQKQKWTAEENARLVEDNSTLLEDNTQLAEENRDLIDKLEENEERNNQGLQERVEELQLVLLTKDAEIDYLTKNNFKVAHDPRKENYEVDMKLMEEECDKLREKVKRYEDILAVDGGEMNRRLDEMYEECVKSVEKVNAEKRRLVEDFQRQKDMYEDLLAECHNEISELTEYKERKTLEEADRKVKPSKREVLEELLSSARTPEELAEILSRDFTDGIPGKEDDLEMLKAENEKLRDNMSKLDNEVTKHQKEVDTVKRKNKDLREKIDLMKSENYVMSKVREGDADENVKKFKELLKAKEEECEQLKKIVDDSVGFEEREELLVRLRGIQRELLQPEDRRQSVNDEPDAGKTQEGVEKEREIGHLKRQNRLLADLIGLDKHLRTAVLDKLSKADEDDVEDVLSNVVKSRPNGDVGQERLKALEDQNQLLESRVMELNGKLLGFGKMEEESQKMSRRAKDAEHQSQTLEDENFGLRERLRSLQKEVKELSFVTRSRKFSKGKANEEILKESDELNERLLLKELEVERLCEELDELKTSLKKREKEIAVWKEQFETLSKASEKIEKLQEDKIENDEKVKELKKKLTASEKDRKQINEEFIKLKIKHEDDAKLFANEMKKLQNDIESLAISRQHTPVDMLDGSYESLPMDSTDGGSSRYDRNKLIKRLQTENHQLTSRILSLEDETTAITKIVADMERGHGHLTGILRGHLVLQKDSTAKLLEGSLEQYSDEFESGKRKFQAIEVKYDREKKYSTRRSFAWDLFANATATINNISAILEEGLIKVEDDLERDFSSDEDFEAKDYKSRLYILRRRLSDVEKRYRDLMLRAEELSVRLDAKTAEYDVTQDELEDATRVLEVNEMTAGRMREELNACLKENAKLKSIMSKLKENQEKTVGAIIAENDMLKKEIENADDAGTVVKNFEFQIKNLNDKLRVDEDEVRDMRRRLHEQEKKERDSIERMKEKMAEDARLSEEELSKLMEELAKLKAKFKESAARIKELEELLKTAEEEKGKLEKYLQKARSGCQSDGIDHHGTIHMLRDDLKKLFKENEELKREINNKQKQITSLAKDLREAKIAVKEQLGTDRSLDEKILDRAAKDQIMALKRRIRVLEIEKERLEKGASIRERDQRLSSDDSIKRKKEARPKSRNEGRDSAASKRGDKGEEPSSQSDVISKADDTSKSLSAGIFDSLDPASFAEGDASLASVESLNAYSDEVKQEIELRDTLIQELESRVRELKQELTLKTGQDRRPSRDAGVGRLDSVDGVFTVDENSSLPSDLQSLAKENGVLREQLTKHKNTPVSSVVKQKDDLIRHQRNKLAELEKEIMAKDNKLKALQKDTAELEKKVGKDWKNKEYVLIEASKQGDVGAGAVFTVDESSSLPSDLQSLARENKALKEQLTKHRSTPVSSLVEQKDDVIRQQHGKLAELEKEIMSKDSKLKSLQKDTAELEKRVGKDWKSKEWILIEDFKGGDAAGRNEELESLKVVVDDLKKKCIERERIIAELEMERTDFAEHSSPIVSVLGSKGGGHRKEAIEAEIEAATESNVETAFEFPPREGPVDTSDSSSRAPKMISIGKSPSNDEKSIEKKGAGRGRSPSRIPISPRPKQMHSQKKVGATHEKLAAVDLEKKVKEQKEDITTLLESVEMFEKEVESMQGQVKQVDGLKEKLKKAEAELTSLKARNSKMQSEVKDSKVHDAKLKDLEDKMKKLITENKNLEKQMRAGNRRHSDAGEKAKSEIGALNARLEDAQKRAESAEKSSEVKEKMLKVVKNELEIIEILPAKDEEKFKRMVREYVKKKVDKSGARKKADKTGDKTEERNVTLEEDLKSKVALIDAKMKEISDLKYDLEMTQEERDSAYKKIETLQDNNTSLGVEVEDLRARNIALEITQEAVSELSAKKHDQMASFYSESASKDLVLSGISDHFVELKHVWDDLKKVLRAVGILTGGDLLVREEDDEKSDLLGGSDLDDIKEVVSEMTEVTRLVGEFSKKEINASENDLETQKILNSELESKVEEFQKIVEETNLRISELEGEVSDKEQNDEIGHKLLLDKVDSLKNEVKKGDTSRKSLEEEVEKREKSIERLTEQVKILEKEVANRESEVSELTQRALDSEEDLELMKSRVEELEDDYNRLLEYGMRLEGGEDEGAGNGKEGVGKEDEELLKKMDEAIRKLEGEKAGLEKENEGLKERVDTQIGNADAAGVKFDPKDDEKYKGMEQEYTKMEGTIYRLELDNADLQKQLEELTADGEHGDNDLREQLQESEKQILSLEGAMFRLELEKATLQKQVDGAPTSEDDGLKRRLLEKEKRISELEDENSRIEDALYRLDLDKTELQKRVDELTFSDGNDDDLDAKLLLLEREEKIDDLEHEKSILAAEKEDLQKTVDDILASPRSVSDEEEIPEEDRGIFKGGPSEWKRRLVASYRELREKSIEVTTLKMILLSKNVEIGLLSNKQREEELGMGVTSSGDGAENVSTQQLKNTVHMLQHEVQMKSKELQESTEETASLQNKLQLIEEQNSSKVALRINGKDESEVEIEELRKQLEKLTHELKNKEESYDSLCDQLFGGDQVVTAAENTQLNNEISDIKKELAEREKLYDELEGNYEIVYNELARMKAGVGTDDAAESDWQFDTANRQSKVKELELALSDYEEKYRLMSQDFDEVEEKYRDEMNYASTHIGQLMIQIGELEEQLRVFREEKIASGTQGVEAGSLDGQSEARVLEERLKYAQEDLKRKNELVTNLKETIASFYANAGDQSESLSNELKRLAKENRDLQDQLELQRQRYELEVDSMRSSMTSVKGEHVKSLKDDFERVCADKVELQVDLSEMKEKVTKQQEKIDELITKNSELEDKLKTKEQDDVLDLLDFTA
eukprot:Seg1268.8 transcript_id=Seg1268.8/GoldUCD/mRNA.D3Y31 product="hypothetical protein" protein_id=Seg1268.8/GoldUCD/D3Y31